jgi:hypothetical protein
MQEGVLKIVALGAAVVLSVACGLGSSAEGTKIAEDIAEKGKKANEDVEEMFAQHRADAAVMVLLRYAKDIDAAIESVEKSSSIAPREKAHLVRALRRSGNGVRDHAKTIRMLESIDVRDR